MWRNKNITSNSIKASFFEETNIGIQEVRESEGEVLIILLTGQFLLKMSLDL